MAKNSEYELAIKIAGKVDSSLKSATKSAKSEISSLSSAAKTAFKGIAVAATAITTAAVAAGKALYDLGVEFDNAYDMIRIGTGATGDALEDLKGSMKDVYASVPTDMESAAQAISDYNTRLGLTGDELETLSKQAIQVSDMLGDDLGGVIEASSQSFQIFNLDAEEMADSMDWLFKVSQSTGIGFTELTSLVQSNGAAFQQMGFSYNESAAMLGKLEKAGYETSTVMTAMTYAVKASAKMGLDAKDAYSQYYDSILNAKDETEAISIAMELFGSRSGTVMAQAIRDGTLAMEDFTAELEASEETIGGAAEDTYDLAEKWTMFTNRMKVALEPMANTLFDSVNEAIEELMPAVEALMPVITDSIDAMLPAIEELVPIVVDFGKQFASEVLPVLSDLIASVLPIVTKLLKSLIPVVMQFVTTLLPPIVRLIDTLLPPLLQIVDAILPVVTSLIEALAPILTSLMTALQPVFDILVQILPPITNIISLLSPLITLIGTLVTQIIDVLSPAISLISGLVTSVLNVAFESIGPVIDGVIGIFSGLIDFVTNIFSGNWSAAWQSIVDVFGNVFGTIANIAKIPINAVISALNWCIDKINGISITIPDWVPGLGGKTFGFSIPTIPLLAEGGIATSATLAMVGEGAEPEAILPLSKLEALMERMGSGKEGTDGESPILSKLVSILERIVSIVGNYAGASVEAVVTVPDVVVPEVDVPPVAVPPVNVPTVNAPTVNVPPVNVPSVNVPASAYIPDRDAAAPAQVEGNEPGEPPFLQRLAAMLEKMGSGVVNNNDNHSEQSDSVVFSPVFNFYGETSKEQAEEAGRISFAEFKRLYQQLKAEERRKSFSMA